MFVIDHGEHGGRHVVYRDGGQWKRGGWDRLSPEEKAKFEAAMKKAHAEMMRAIPLSHEAMEKAGRAMADAHRQIADARRQMFQLRALGPGSRQTLEWGDLTPEQSQQIQKSIGEAMKHAELAMAPDDGRVMMRCKLGPDGNAEDCVRAFAGPIRHFELHRLGPEDSAPPALPASSAPPAPPAKG